MSRLLTASNKTNMWAKRIGDDRNRVYPGELFTVSTGILEQIWKSTEDLEKYPPRSVFPDSFWAAPAAGLTLVILKALNPAIPNKPFLAGGSSRNKSLRRNVCEVRRSTKVHRIWHKKGRTYQHLATNRTDTRVIKQSLPSILPATPMKGDTPPY